MSTLSYLSDPASRFRALGHTAPPSPRAVLLTLPPSSHSTTATYATSPPSSTYHKSLPQINGTFSGFVGLLTGLGLLLLLVLAALAFLRYRQLQRKVAAHSAINRAAAGGTYGQQGRQSTDGYGGPNGGRYGEGGVDEEAFELPRDYEGVGGGGYGFSSVSLGDGGQGRGGYRDPYAESRSSLVGEEDRRKAEAVYDDLDGGVDESARR